MNIKVNKYIRDSVINTLRQTAMCCVPELRPIGIRVGAGSLITDLGDGVEEDTAEFISNLQSSVYKPTNLEIPEFIKVETEVSNALTLTQLRNASTEIQVAQVGVEEVLHTLSTTHVEIYFRFAAGKFTQAENEAFLRKSLKSFDGVVPFSSRHCPVVGFTANPVVSADDDSEYEIRVRTNSSWTEEEVLKISTNLLRNEVGKLG